MRLCSYVVKHDTGFAPNPFWRYCTLVGCTPNHMGIKLDRGDWIFGNSDVKNGNKLIYAMEVFKRLHLNDYFHDQMFQKKKPKMDGTWRQLCGDNIYFKQNGEWDKIASLYHWTQAHTIKDTKHPTVYISKHYYYFGENAVKLPKKYRSLLKDKQGVTCKHDPKTVDSFLKWINQNYKPGIHGKPRDRLKGNCKNEC